MVLVPLCAALVFCGCLGGGDDDDEPRVLTMERTYSSQDELNAIQAAESLNYSALLNLSRYEDRHSDPNYLDSQVLAKYEAQDGDLVYSAVGEYQEDCTLTLKASGSMLVISAGGTELAGEEDYLFLSDMTIVRVQNLSASSRVNAGTLLVGSASNSTDLSACYLVRMRFSYGKENDGYGYGHEIFQLVVLDDALEPVMVVHQATQTWQSEGF